VTDWHAVFHTHNAVDDVYTQSAPAAVEYPTQVACLVIQAVPAALTEHEASKVWHVENVRPVPVFLAQLNVQASVATAPTTFVHPNLYNSQSACVPLNVVQAPVA
jgi:hypothetical protein